VHQHPAPALGVPDPEPLGHLGHHRAHRRQRSRGVGGLVEDLGVAAVQLGQLPAPGGPHRDPPAAGTAKLATNQQQPGTEDGGRVGALDVFEEGGIRRAGGVVEGEEDHPAPRAHRRRLGGHLDPGDQHLTAAATAEQIGGEGHPEQGQELQIVTEDMPAGIQADDLQLGRQSLGTAQLRQPGGHDVAGGPRPRFADLVHALDTRVEVQRDLDLLGAGRRGRPRLPPGQVARIIAQRPGRRRAAQSAGASGQTAIDPGRPFQVADAEQQVAPGEPAAAGDRFGVGDAVQAVECAGQHQPLGDRRRVGGAPPEVGERVVGTSGDDPGDLGFGDPLDIGQRQPDAVAAAVRQAGAGGQPGSRCRRRRDGAS